MNPVPQGLLNCEVLWGEFIPEWAGEFTEEVKRLHRRLPG
jgi:hypothetical protein